MTTTARSRLPERPMAGHLMTMSVLGLALAACSSPPPRLAATATLTCDELEALTPGAGAACASDDLRGVELEALTVVDAASREPIVALERPKVWGLPSRGRLDRLVVAIESKTHPRADSLAQLTRTVDAFTQRGWRCSDPALPTYLQDARSLEGLPYDAANDSGCRLEREHPDASPWRCESPPGGPRIVLHVSLRCREGADAPLTWSLVLDRVDAI